VEPIIAKCGYRCDQCLAHETNLKSDEDKQRMSEALKRYYRCDVPPEKIKSCKGCQLAPETPDPQCPVYPCATARGLENCGQCPDFGCDKLKCRMDVVEEFLAKAGEVPSVDYETFFRPYLSRELLTEIHESQNN